MDNNVLKKLIKDLYNIFISQEKHKFFFICYGGLRSISAIQIINIEDFLEMEQDMILIKSLDTGKDINIYENGLEYYSIEDNILKLKYGNKNINFVLWKK